MKRKVIKQGVSTLTISLPTYWTKKFNIKPGDEIELEDRGKELTITTEKNFSSKNTTIDISKLTSKKVIRHFVNNIYIRGDDELAIMFDKPEKMDIIQDCINFNIGFAVVKQEKNSCVIKDVSGITDSEFNNMLKRVFFMIQAFGEEGLELIRRQQLPEDFWKRDLAIDKYVYYCLRMLNKKGYPEFEKTNLYYIVLLLLEYLADEYTRLYKNASNARFSKSTISIFSEVNDMYKQFFDNFYKFNPETTQALIMRRNEIRDKTAKPTKTEDIVVLYYLRKIAEIIINIVQIQLQLVL